MSFVLCFSNLISSFNACSFNLVLNSSSFCFIFSSLIFSNLSFSCFSNFNLLDSSFFKVLYSRIVFAILSKNAWIYFSIFKFNFKFISRLKEFWKLIILEIKFFFFIGFTLKILVLLLFKILILENFNLDLTFLIFFL